MLEHHESSDRSRTRAQVSRRSDRLARVIVADLLRTTAGFLLVVTAIVLAVHLLT
jgi:hypothetical protein